MTSKTPLSEVEIRELRGRIAGMSHAEKVSLGARLKPIAEKRARKSVNKSPTTDDELWEWIRDQTGLEIPRVAVCEDHCAPFDFMADAYFDRESALLVLASRESGKSVGCAALNYAFCENYPGAECCSFAAIEAQAKRVYGYVKNFVYRVNENGEKVVKSQIEGDPQRSQTVWKSGSKMEVLIATKSGVNSPHPQKVHADEVDLMDPEVFQESRSMSSSKIRSDGTRIPALDIVTSTRKSMHGPMQALINEVEEAQRTGYEPPWKLYAFCCFETSEEVAHCRRAPSDDREKRLTELGRNPTERCSCDKVAKGEWNEGSPRTLDGVCQGKFFRSRGWMPHDDVKRKFRQNTQAVWEAQMECRRPMADGLYLPGWSRERFTVRGWMPHPHLGQVWLGADWGGSAESAILWVQGPLRVPVKFAGSEGQVLVPMNSYVVFDELLEANIGASKLGDQVVARELGWRRQIPGFRVTARFADMAGKQQRDDWREHDPPLRTVWYLPNRDFDPTVTVLQDLVADQRYWVDSARCSRHCDDVESWRQKNGREVHDQSSHTAAASRYLHANVAALERRRQHKQVSTSASPVVVQRAQQMAPVAVGSGGDQFAGERAWRESLGDHFPNRGR